MLITNMEECEKYIDEIVEGKNTSNSEIGDLLNKCMSQFTAGDMKVLEQMIAQNYKYATITNSLSKLQMAQVNLTEKMNSVFGAYLNKFITQ